MSNVYKLTFKPISKLQEEINPYDLKDVLDSLKSNGYLISYKFYKDSVSLCFHKSLEVQIFLKKFEGYRSNDNEED